jgi:tetratricopeptide (TPR) repeat protein
MNLARTLIEAGDYAGALDAAERALGADPGHAVRVTTLKNIINANLALRRLPEANAALAELRAISVTPVGADEWEARVRFAERDYEAALALVEAFPEAATDDALTVVGRGALAEIEIQSMLHVGRPHQAANRLRELIRAGEVPMSLAQVAEVLTVAGSTIAEVALLVPVESIRGLLFNAQEAPVELADELLEALWARPGAQAPVLAFAAQIGGRLPVIRALEWSARLRSCGLERHCTLLTLAADGRRTPRERAVAAAVALEMFGDEAAMPVLAEALDAVADADAASVLDELALLAPNVAAAIEPATA